MIGSRISIVKRCFSGSYETPEIPIPKISILIMLAMQKLLIISLVLLGAVSAALDENCVSWDDKIEPTFLKPFREILKNSSSEFISFGEWKIGHFGFDASWKKGDVGNLSNVHLATVEGQNSAHVCTSGNVRRLTLDLNVDFGRLDAHFGSFVFSLPFFKTEDAWAIFTSPGCNAVVTVTATQDISTGRCSISLDKFMFNKFGYIELTLRGNAGRNLLAELLFNANRARIVKFLSAVGVGKKVNKFAQDKLSAALENHSDFICSIIS